MLDINREIIINPLATNIQVRLMAIFCNGYIHKLMNK